MKKQTEEKKLEARRGLLKGLVAGGGAAVGGRVFSEKWSRPHVDAVIVPAHALTTRPDKKGDREVKEEVPLSDRAVKHAIAPVDVQCILEGIASLPVSTWSYNDSPGVRHVGPMAQDFHAAFGLGDSDRHIHNVDSGGVALAAIQALYQMVRERDDRIARLEARLDRLSGEVSANA